MAESAALAAGKMPVMPAADIRIVPGVAQVPAPHNVDPVGERAPETASLVSEALVCRPEGRSPVAQLAFWAARMCQNQFLLRCRLVQLGDHTSLADL